MVLECEDGYEYNLATYFESFLNSSAFDQFCHDWRSTRLGDAPTLMDLVGAWSVYGDATYLCDSFEVFLLAVVVISPYYEGGNIFDTPLWRDEQGRPVRLAGYAPSLIEPHVWNVASHPAMSRTRWELIKADRRSLQAN